MPTLRNYIDADIFTGGRDVHGLREPWMDVFRAMRGGTLVSLMHAVAHRRRDAGELARVR